MPQGAEGVEPAREGEAVGRWIPLGGAAAGGTTTGKDLATAGEAGRSFPAAEADLQLRETWEGAPWRASWGTAR